MQEPFLDGDSSSLLGSDLTFPPLPYAYDVGPVWLFFGLQATGGTNPPDFVPDPAVRFLNVPPTALTISRYTNGPFGPWDQVCRGQLCANFVLMPR